MVRGQPRLTEAVAATGLVAALPLVPGIWTVTQRLSGITAGIEVG